MNRLVVAEYASRPFDCGCVGDDDAFDERDGGVDEIHLP